MRILPHYVALKWLYKTLVLRLECVFEKQQQQPSILNLKSDRNAYFIIQARRLD